LEGRELIDKLSVEGELLDEGEDHIVDMILQLSGREGT